MRRNGLEFVPVMFYCRRHLTTRRSRDHACAHLPFELSSHGLLVLKGSTGAILPAARLEVSAGGGRVPAEPAAADDRGPGARDADDRAGVRGGLTHDLPALTLPQYPLDLNRSVRVAWIQKARSPPKWKSLKSLCGGRH